MITVIGELNILPLFDGRVLPQCDIVCAPAATELRAESSVLIVGKGAVLPDKISVMAAVVDSDGDLDLRRLNGIPVITCGLGSRNTISITSRTTEFVTISLNRSIHTLNGLCEPLEIPLAVREGVEDHAYMAALAAALLLGKAG